MIILAIESSAKPASVAVYKTPVDHLPGGVVNTNGKLLGQDFQNNGFSHSRTLLVMVDSLLKNLNIKLAEIDLFAVAHGPGSFTGVRIGVSAIKGLAWGLDKPVCGVSTLEAIAYQTQVRDMIVCPIMDARREQVYNALFEWKDERLIRLRVDRAISLDELGRDLQCFDKPCLLVGDGAFKVYDDPGCQMEHPIQQSTLFGLDDSSPDSYEATLFGKEGGNLPDLRRYQTAHGVAIAALYNIPIPAAELEPFYLRPSQAERVRSAEKVHNSEFTS